MNATEIDSLHILPLLQMPIETLSLRQARLVKNARLESMVELFDGDATGSGQLPPERLRDYFDLSGSRERDFEIICRLGELPSYDVYSLRLSLRGLGIDITDLEGLKLSEAKVVELTQYMSEFTRPLVRFVYGENAGELESLADLLHLFADPSASEARDNLNDMAVRLDVDLTRIPKFLEDYADVYMSLSFYRQCLDQLAPLLADFLATLKAIRGAPGFARNRALIHDCVLIERQLDRLYLDVGGVLDDFRRRTEHMWENLSAEYYRQMESMVIGQQTRIGEILCALTVKMMAWDARFPVAGDGQLSAKAAFVVGEMKHGLDRLRPLDLASRPEPSLQPA